MTAKQGGPAKIPGDRPSELLVTVPFEGEGGKTKMTLRHDGLPSEMIDDCGAGGSGSFEKLADSLGQREIPMARTGPLAGP